MGAAAIALALFDLPAPFRGGFFRHSVSKYHFDGLSALLKDNGYRILPYLVRSARMDSFSSETMGPRLAALGSEQRRLFAFYMGCGELNATEAAREAGFVDNGNGAIRVRAHVLMHDPDVLEAIQEVASKRLRSLPPIAISTLATIMQDPKATVTQRLATALAVLDRTGFASKTEHKVTVEHVDDGRLVELATRLALELGVDGAKLIGGNLSSVALAKEDVPRETQPVIEAQATEVVGDA